MRLASGAGHDTGRGTAPVDIDAFVHAVTHDLKGAADGIQTHLQFLLEDHGHALDTDGQEQCELVRSLAGRLVRKLDGLGELHLVSHHPLTLQQVDLESLFASVTRMQEATVPGRPEVATAAAGLPRVEADPFLLTRLFTHLISNALIFHDGSTPRVSIAWRDTSPPSPDRIVLCVSDDGIGIAEKHHASVFTLFERLHGPDAFGGGAGAGLTVARKIVERHGGEIWVESSPGEGTTVCFTLERAVSTAPAVRPTNEAISECRGRSRDIETRDGCEARAA
jgi:light-regulated signal transduction histidine kinase (bacteriophytochrome)